MSANDIANRIVYERATVPSKNGEIVIHASLSVGKDDTYHGTGVSATEDEAKAIARSFLAVDIRENEAALLLDIAFRRAERLTKTIGGIDTTDPLVRNRTSSLHGATARYANHARRYGTVVASECINDMCSVLKRYNERTGWADSIDGTDEEEPVTEP